MSSYGNNGQNKDEMLTTRRELKKDEYTGEALLQLQKLKDLVSSVTIEELLQEPIFIPVKDLITVYKWCPQLCNIATFLPIFSDIIKDRQVKIEDVPKFDKLMYKILNT